MNPFPGMDPFLEDQAWLDFHADFISAIRSALLPALRPKYIARIEERVYLQFDSGGPRPPVRPDLTVLRDSGGRGESRGGTAVLAESVLLNLPEVEEVREAYLEVRLRETHEVVTVIEVLSPTNKRANSEGRASYLAKRDVVTQSRTHLIEIDLLRGGQRMPMREPYPPCDYSVLVSRAAHRPLAQVWALTLRHPLPIIPVPLAGDDPDAVLNLQAVFNTVYERAGYDYSIDYQAPILPPLGEEDTAWMQGLLQAQHGAEVAGAD